MVEAHALSVETVDSRVLGLARADIIWHSVKEFIQETFSLLGLDWEKYVKYDARYERPSEVDLLIGDPAKAKRQLGWEPKVRFKELVKIMTEADLELAKREAQIAQLPKP